MKNLSLIFLFTVFIASLQAQGINIDSKIKSETTQISKCDYCLCSMGISPLDFSGKGIRIDPRYLFIDKKIKDGKVVANTEGSYERHFTLQFSGIYPVTRKFSVIGIVPYSMREERAGSFEPALNTAGIGDISVLGRYNVIDMH